MANFTAVFDACVLYPAPLRDLLVSVATTEQFRARWTDEIHNEWTRNVLANRPEIKAADLERTVELMNQAVPDCLVENYEGLIDSLDLPDPDDRHVLAAAIKSQADVIVTNNLKDFPEDTLKQYEVEAQSPDTFLNHLYDLNPTAFCSAVRQQRERLQNPKYTAEELLEIFYNQGLPLTVNKLRDIVDLL
ncbi:MAG: PIN domain-containing protein [Ectothiorhodospiraceae bacterium]|nr:PIN domain-containing protein [Ectothiorhodospiraceae bacterium]